MKSLTIPQAVLFLRARHPGPAGPDRVMEAQLIDMQRQLCTEVARVLGATIVREYAEYGGTGAIERRPQVKRLLDDLHTLTDVAYVIVSSPDRLARKRADDNVVQRALDATNTRLIVASDILTIHPPKEVQA